MEADGCCHGLTLAFTLSALHRYFGEPVFGTWDEILLSLRMAETVLREES
jgi:hypothetical protein